MPTTIFDSSLITQRNKNKTIANSFISRIQNPSPVNGSAPLLGITEQSLINSVVNGQSIFYRKTDSGCTSVNLGCPCAVQSNTIISVTPGPVTNITYQYGSLIISWDAPTTGNLPFTYLVELQATNPVYNVSATTSNTTYTFINSQLQPGVGYEIAVTPSNTAGTGPTSYYEEEGVPVQVIGIYQAPTITVSSSGLDTCTLGFSFPISGTGFTITSVITDPSTPLPSGWSIQSFSNSQIVLLNSGSNPASIPSPGIKFIFGGALGQITNSSDYVTGIQTTGSIVGNYWATSMGSNTANAPAGITKDSSGNIYIIGTFTDSTFVINNYTSISAGNVVTSAYGTLVNSTGTNTDIFLVKYNALGQVVWVTSITGINIEFASAVTTDSSDNIFITGYTNSDITINNKNSVVSGVIQVTPFGILPRSAGNYDTFVIKYDSNGQTQWASRVGSAGTNFDERGIAICTDSSNNIYIAGHTNSRNDITITSYNGKDASNIIQLDNWGIIRKTSTGFDSFLVKYNTLGIAQWATMNSRISGNNFTTDLIYNANDNTINIYAQASANIEINSWGSVDVITKTITLNQLGILSISGTTLYLVKYDTSGQAQLVTSITGGTNGRLTADSTGNIYIGFLTPLSLISINNNVSGTSVTPYASLAGPTPAGHNDGYIVKYNNLGGAQWGTKISADANTGILDIKSDGTYIYVIGYFLSTSVNVNNFDGITSGNIDLALYGSLDKGSAYYDYYIAKYNASGEALWTTRLDGRSSSATPFARITIDSSGNVCATGFYDINPLAISAFSNTTGGIINVTPYGNLATSGTSNSFVIKLNSSGQFT